MVTAHDLCRSLLLTAGVREGSIDALLASVGSYAQIAVATVAELRAAGVSCQLAERLGAAMEFARVSKSAAGRETMGNAEDVWHHLRHRVPHEQEAFYVIALDVRNQLLDIVEVARGNVCGVEVHPREVFRPAIRLAAAGVIVAHNHPSGDPTPSAQDIELTRRLRDVGTTLGIPVLDHVVVTPDRYRSICESMGAAW